MILSSTINKQKIRKYSVSVLYLNMWTKLISQNSFLFKIIMIFYLTPNASTQFSVHIL